MFTELNLNTKAFYDSLGSSFKDVPLNGLALPILLKNAGQTLISILKATEGAFFYPFYGMMYVMRHPLILRPIMLSFVVGIASAIVITVLLLSFALLPQIAAFTLLVGPLSPVVAGIATLIEGYVLLKILMKIFCFDSAFDKIFDQVLKSENVTLNSKKQTSKKTSLPTPKPNNSGYVQSILASLIQYILTLPLTFIPGIGFVMYLFLNSTRASLNCHRRYFELKQLDNSATTDFVDKRRAAYISFGMTSLLLDLLPVVNILFNFTNVVGAALWACHMERTGASHEKVN